MAENRGFGFGLKTVNSPTLLLSVLSDLFYFTFILIYFCLDKKSSIGYLNEVAWLKHCVCDEVIQSCGELAVLNCSAHLDYSLWLVTKWVSESHGLLCVCVLLTQGKLSGQYCSSQTVKKSVDMKLRMEELILGPTSARSEMMRRRLNGLLFIDNCFTCSWSAFCDNSAWFIRISCW